jgi:hypothetical protein
VDQYAPSLDGQRFLMMTPLSDSDAPPTLVVNWPSLLKKYADPSFTPFGRGSRA